MLRHFLFTTMIFLASPALMAQSSTFGESLQDMDDSLFSLELDLNELALGLSDGAVVGNEFESRLSNFQGLLSGMVSLLSSPVDQIQSDFSSYQADVQTGFTELQSAGFLLEGALDDITAGASGSLQSVADQQEEAEQDLVRIIAYQLLAQAQVDELNLSLAASRQSIEDATSIVNDNFDVSNLITEISDLEVAVEDFFDSFEAAVDAGQPGEGLASDVIAALENEAQGIFNQIDVLQTYTPTAPSYASTGFPLTNADSELSEATTSIQNAQVFVEEVINSSSPELLATPSPVQSPSQQFGTQASNQFGNQASNAPEGGQSASPESGGDHSAPFEGSLALMLGFFGFMALRRRLQQG